jgi:hypothetical protein
LFGVFGSARPRQAEKRLGAAEFDRINMRDRESNVDLSGGISLVRAEKAEGFTVRDGDFLDLARRGEGSGASP